MPPEKTPQAPASCAKCGACVPVCPLYGLFGRESFTARGKLHLLQKLPLSAAGSAYAGILSRCLLCGACSSVCPRGLDIPSLLSGARAELPPGLIASPPGAEILKFGMRHGTVARLVGGAARGLLRLLPEDSGLRLKLSLPATDSADTGNTGRTLPPAPASVSDTSKAVALFEGCYARYLQNEITEATGALVSDRLHLEPYSPEGQKCCGLAFSSAGQRQQALELARSNIEAFAFSTGPILVSCASCFSHLSSYPSLFVDDPDWHRKALDFTGRLQEFSSFFLNRQLIDRLARTSRQASVYFHDSCHLRFHSRITAPPRTLLRSITSLRLVEPAEGYQCCGAGGLFQLYHPESSDSLQSELMATVATLDVSYVLTTCSGCLLQLHQGVTAHGLPVRVRHFAVFLAELFD